MKYIEEIKRKRIVILIEIFVGILRAKYILLNSYISIHFWNWLYIDLEYPEFSQDKDQVHELLGFLFGWSRYRKRLARGSQVHCRHRETPEVSNMQRNHRWSRHFEHLWSFLLFIVFEPLSSNAIEVSHLSHTLHREQYSQKFVVGRSLSSIFSNTFIIVAIGKHNIREDQPEATNLCYRDGIEAKEKGRTTASM